MLLTLFLALCVFHIATIILIRVTSGDIFANLKADLPTVMRRLKERRPVAHRVYQVSLGLPLVYLVMMVGAKLLDLAF
ncbi:hypothetical protein [Methylibium sp.]|uniref:hypothetical protein n=1 Tax=Methylibium sp. TaxID=2067992 RepID=UPI003D100EB6